MTSTFPKSRSAPLPPSRWVTRWIAPLPAGASALDFACGGGRHTTLLLEAGARVTAVDIDRDALAALDFRAEAIACDLERDPWPFGERRFDVVVCCNYLFRPRLDLLFDRVAPGGLLIYETFALGHARYGRPSNPDYLLRPGELSSVATRAGLTVVAYENGFSGTPREALVQRLSAARPPFEPQRYALVG